MIIVSDTSSISNLLQIGLIDILYTLFGEVTITPAVRDELFFLPEQRAQIRQLSWINVKPPQDRELVNKLLADVDLGEAESIALALEEKAMYLIIDEYTGRQIADSYGIKIVGILGILILAKSEEIIPAIKPHIEQLLEVGFRIQKKLIEKVLTSLGEADER